MDTFFLEFRDPLFGLIIFFALVFMITFVSYWWGKYKLKDDFKHLDKFLKQFQSPPSKNELKNLISKSDVSNKTWLLLANLYSKDGDYEKSIEIYTQLLNINNNSNYRDMMFLLGQTYFKAGFLERSKQVFLEILKKQPRTPQALKALLLVYEQTREYDLALEVLEPLKELNNNIEIDTTYIQTIHTINNKALSLNDKKKILLNLYHSTSKLTHLTFEFLFRIDSKTAWHNINISKIHLMTDILWFMDKKDLDLDIITQNGYLRELYTARGDIELASSSDIFEFDLLINLKNKDSATLNFEYRCSKCQQTSPFSFSRCSYCYSIDSARVEMNLVKNYKKKFEIGNNSFM